LGDQAARAPHRPRIIQRSRGRSDGVRPGSSSTALAAVPRRDRIPMIRLGPAPKKA